VASLNGYLTHDRSFWAKTVYGLDRVVTVSDIIIIIGVTRSVLVKALCYKPEGRGFETRWDEFCSVYLILLAALGPEVHPASNRNQYQKQKKGWADYLDNVKSLTSLNPIGLQGLLRRWFYFMETECASCEVRTGL
jgi:hypothetical protein